jgi:hypothetical protein
MNTPKNFTLENFQEHPDFIEHFEDYWGNQSRAHRMFDTDLSVDGKVVGRAYKKCGNDYPIPATHFTLDGTNWYAVQHTFGRVHVTKRVGENGAPSYMPVSNRWRLSHYSSQSACQDGVSIPELKRRLAENNEDTEFDDVMLAYAHLETLIEAVASKEPPKKP